MPKKKGNGKKKGKGKSGSGSGTVPAAAGADEGEHFDDAPQARGIRLSGKDAQGLRGQEEDGQHFEARIDVALLVDAGLAPSRFEWRGISGMADGGTGSEQATAATASLS